MRPYRQLARYTVRGAPGRLRTGHQTLLGRARTWRTQSPGQRTAGLIAATLATLKAAEIDHRLVPLAAAGYATAAWRAGPSSIPPPMTADQARTRFLQMLADLIGDRPGIHLAELLDTMGQADADWATWDFARLRLALEAVYVEPRRSINLPTGNRTGVHRDDVQAALQRTTTPPVTPAPTEDGQEPLTSNVEHSTTPQEHGQEHDNPDRAGVAEA